MTTTTIYRLQTRFTGNQKEGLDEVKRETGLSLNTIIKLAVDEYLFNRAMSRARAKEISSSPEA